MSIIHKISGQYKDPRENGEEHIPTMLFFSKMEEQSIDMYMEMTGKETWEDAISDAIQKAFQTK